MSFVVGAFPLITGDPFLIRPLAKVIFATENAEKKRMFLKVFADSVAEKENLIQEIK